MLRVEGYAGDLGHWLMAVQVGNEFSSVEALWSQFENVMAKDPDAEPEGQGEEGEDGHGEDETELSEQGNGR